MFIVGGGPAGLAVAIALRAKGFDVTLADPAQPPIDKTCGEGLMPDALAALKKLGVTLAPEDGIAFRGICFVGQGVSGDSVRVDSCFPEGEGLGIRRTRLHAALLERATATGVRMLWGTPVRAIDGDRVNLTSATVQARWIVGADGENSRVRGWSGLDAAWIESRRLGFRRHYRTAASAINRDVNFVEIYWARGCQSYVTPISEQEICVVAMARNSRRRSDDVLKRMPVLEQKLQDATVMTTERGAVSASRILRRVYKGNVVLVGDASGSVDAITGEGMRLSFEQSLALADALESGDLRAYQSAHRRLALRPCLMSGLMLSLDWSDLLRRRALAAFEREPALFRNLLATHIGVLSPLDSLRRGIIPLTLGILTA